MPPRVCLHESGLGLIIEHATGIVYSNQTRGFCCDQPELEGAFVPIQEQVLGLEQQLSARFTGPKYNGSGAMHGLDGEDADRVDEVLRASHLTVGIRVDRALLKDSCEAWIHVQIEETELSLFTDFGPYPRRAVLTWQNSD